MENLITSATNLSALPAIVINFSTNHPWRGTAITFAMTASIAYHLVEKHKHHLPGIGSVVKKLGFEKIGNWMNKETTHHRLLNLDRLGVGLVVLSFLNHPNLLTRSYELAPQIGIAFTFLLVSESFHHYDQLWSKLGYRTNSRYGRMMFTCFHGIWHLYAFNLVYQYSL